MHFSDEPVAFSAPRDLFSTEPPSDDVGKHWPHPGYSTRFHENHLTAWKLERGLTNTNEATPERASSQQSRFTIATGGTKIQKRKAKSNIGETRELAREEIKAGSSSDSSNDSDTETKSEPRVSPPKHTQLELNTIAGRGSREVPYEISSD